MSAAFDFDHAIGPMGFEIPVIGASIQQKLDESKRAHEAAVAANPLAYQMRDPKAFIPKIKEAWDKFQQSKGRAPGSNDLTLIVEFVTGGVWAFLPQDIGSCVWSNTFRVWIERLCVEVCLRGDAEAYLGTDQFGLKSFAPHCVTYGFAREIANMRGGDGLYGPPMVQALMEGVVLCSTPKLKELMDAEGATKPEDYPEPRSARLYRKIGDWAWNKVLAPYRCCKLEESIEVDTIEKHIAMDDALKPMFQCSGIAIKKIGVDKDGFDIHDINEADSWGHNMGWSGFRLNSKGDRFHRLSNRSWTQPGQDPDKLVYNIPTDRLARWYARKLVDTHSIGEISGIPLTPPGV